MIDDSIERRGEILLVGEYGNGAYGPTIMLQLVSEESVVWLRSLFFRLIQAAISIELAEEPCVDLYQIRRLSMRCGSPDRHLVRSGTDAFDWIGDSAYWEDCAALMEPFISGQSGHQYLTSEAVDDALVQVSYREPQIQVPAVRSV